MEENINSLIYKENIVELHNLIQRVARSNPAHTGKF